MASSSPRDLSEVPNEDLTAREWVEKFGSIAGFPMDCRSNPGKRHALIAHDCEMWTAVTRKAIEFKPEFTTTAYGSAGEASMIHMGTLRVSPVIMHMLLCDKEPRCQWGETTLTSLGFKLICTPAVLPGTVIRVQDDGRPTN